jgi:Cof subfamily protein (haloacid dehalogenase superfamily)
MTSPNPRPFDLVVLDLDGTILAHDGTISPGVHTAIAQVQAAGVPVTIATGRTLDFVRAVAAPLGITAPVVTTQGAVVGDPVTGHLLFEETIAAPEARRLAAWADGHARLCALFFNDDGGHTHIAQNLDPGFPGHYDHIMGKPRITVGPLVPLLESLVRHGAPDPAHPQPAAHEPVKFMIVSDVREEADLATALQTLFGAGVTVARTHPLLIEITAPGVDKGAGVCHLCAHLGISPARVVAVGDNDNDVSIFAAVGAAVAMASGSPAARAAAAWIAPPIEADGAAIALRALVLGDEAALAQMRMPNPPRP